MATTTRVVMMRSALSAEEIALETVPAGCELVLAKPGTGGFVPRQNRDTYIG